MNDVRFPELRRVAREAIRVFADEDFHKNQWLRQAVDLQPTGYDDIGDCFGWLYDDAQVLPDPASAVPEVLRASEVESLRALEEVLGPLRADHRGAGSAEFMNDVRWPAVVEAANAVLVQWPEDLPREASMYG